MSVSEIMGNVCKFFQYGHCKFGEKCRKEHLIEKCRSSSCEREKSGCRLRHPIQCRYFSTYKQCKFGDYCSYEHELLVSETSSANDSFNDKTKEFSDKIVFLESAISLILKSKENEMDKFEKIIFNLVNRIATLENNQNISAISSNEVVGEKQDSVEILNDTVDSEILLNSNSIPQLDGCAVMSKYPCDECEFRSDSKEDLKLHKTKIHKTRKKRNK